MCMLFFCISCIWFHVVLKCFGKIYAVVFVLFFASSSFVLVLWWFRKVLGIFFSSRYYLFCQVLKLFISLPFPSLFSEVTLSEREKNKTAEMSQLHDRMWFTGFLESSTSLILRFSSGIIPLGSLSL